MTWLNLKEVMELSNITQQAVSKNVKNGKYGDDYRYIDGLGRGGKILQISLAALPENARNKYYLELANKGDTDISTDEIDVNKPFDNFTLSQQEKALKKVEAIEEYKKFRKTSKKSAEKFSETKCKDEFIEKWNSKNEDFQITRSTLYLWLKKEKEGKTFALVDKRGGHNKGTSSIPKEVWNEFKKYYLQESQPTIKTCYEIAKVYAVERKIVIPGYNVFKYQANRIDYPTLVLYREGRKAYDDKCSPHMERDYTKISSNEIWVSDHHLWDEHIIVEEKGQMKLKKIRLWGSYWMDMRSRKIVSKFLRVGDPNSDVVLASFAEGVKGHGIPKEILLDNGKDYKAKDLFNNDYNGKELFEDTEKRTYVKTLAMQMDIKVHFAIPYNAKAKPIERTFNTFESQFGRLFKTYLGSNPAKRPEQIKKLGLEEYPTFEEYKKLHDDYIENVYNEDAHRGDGMNGKSPNQVYDENLHEVRKAPESVLRQWLMRTTRAYTVQRNGIRLFDSWYISKEMHAIQTKKVYARYSPENIEEIYIYDEDMRYLFMAYRKVKMQFGASKEDYQREYQYKKEALAAARAGKPQVTEKTRNVDDIARILDMRKQENEANPKKYEKPNTVEVLARNEQLEEAARKVQLSQKELIFERAEELRKQEEKTKEMRQKQDINMDKVSKLWDDRIKQNQSFPQINSM